MAVLAVISTTTTGREKNIGGIEHINQSIQLLRYARARIF
jgi:hypothetical protein